MERVRHDKSVARLQAIDQLASAIEMKTHTEFDLIRGQRNARALIKDFDEQCSFESADSAEKVELLLKDELKPGTAADLRALVLKMRT